MQRIKAIEWRRQYYSPHGAPSDRWVQNQIRDGKIPGEKKGGIWFVHVRDGGLELDYGKPEPADAVDMAAAALITDWMQHESTSA